MELAHAATRSSQLIAEIAHRHTSRFTCAARGGWGRARLASSHLAVAGAELDRRRCRSCPRLASPPDASPAHIFPYPLRFILA
ncbi:hypothetical protein SORBI_3002G201300 [Sorghum bicolor]|uniref:Uncharacterized protein n=1 Tax=Sorghum bicolor TaxID=4558 RepID=C5XCT1_SORBI|nr:hypothetical protein SORBI_3002G201300 [Sorghum bicolor]